jgi:hypothetical protein
MSASRSRFSCAGEREHTQSRERKRAGSDPDVHPDERRSRRSQVTKRPGVSRERARPSRGKTRSGVAIAAATLLILQGCGGSSSCKSTAPPARGDGDPAVQSIALPASLAAETSVPELSGIAWSQSLQRYIVVSDDTGRPEDGTRHAPWAFTLSENGKLDEATLPIAGIAELNDLEAVCPGPAGTFFLTTSHSLTRKGKSPESRKHLLQVQLVDGNLRVMGRVDLTTLKSPDGKGLLGIAGLDEAGALDIEALAWRQDELLIGLKSPLNAQGEASIIVMRNPAAVLSSIDMPAGALAVWRTVPLCLALPNGKVCEGISDLAFLPDGSLAMTGNAPKGAAHDGGGALWHLPASQGSSPRLIKKFQGLKPEGVALSPDQKSLVVVFDRDRQTPAWTRWPLPL